VEGADVYLTIDSYLDFGGQSYEVDIRIGP
jgi:hypothetical protein